MSTDDHALYLGTEISSSCNPREEIQRRINITNPALKKLELFWSKASCNPKWKLQVYNAVVISRLLYGLENIDGTEAVNNMLDTFQLKGLRKYWGYKPHTWTETTPTFSSTINATKNWISRRFTR